MKFQPKERNIKLNVIASYDEYPQEVFDVVLDIQPINRTKDKQVSVEKKILQQVINCLSLDYTDHLFKISLCYSLPDFNNEEEMIENGFGFIGRTNSKYLFRPDERSELEQLLCEEMNIASKTKSLRQIMNSEKKVSVQ